MSNGAGKVSRWRRAGEYCVWSEQGMRRFREGVMGKDEAPDGISRRSFLRTAAGLPLLGGVEWSEALRADAGERSRVYRVDRCPVHDGQLRHVGVDSLLRLMASNGEKFYRTRQRSTWGGPQTRSWAKATGRSTL